MRCLKLVSYQIFTKVRFKLNMLMRVCLYYYKENDVVHHVCIWAGLLCKPLERRLKLFTFLWQCSPQFILSLVHGKMNF